MPVFIIGLLLFGASSPAREYCQRGQPCWPTAADIRALNASLNPTAPRVAAYRRDFPTYARAWDVATPGMVFGAAAVGTPGGANACRVFFAASDKTVRKAGKCPAEQHHDEL